MVEEISDVDDPRVAPFCRLTEAQLLNRTCPDRSMFIAESPKVIQVALDHGYTPVSLLCERKHIDGDASEIIKRIGDVPVYTGSREILSTITGYKLSRGVLCAMRRPVPLSVEDVCRNARRVVVIDGVSDTTNIGTIFRSAAALGMDAVLLTPTSCDPYNRRAVRVSMGSVFVVPWTWVDPALLSLRSLGFKTVAMALRNNSVNIDDQCLKKEPRLAIMMGEEGYGLSSDAIDNADYVVKIPMHKGVDSLNVGAAAAIAIWELSK